MKHKLIAQGAGIKCDSEQLMNGGCSLDVYKTIGVTPTHKNAKSLLQDVFGGATFFIGTVVTIALIVSGLFLIFGGADQKQADKGKKGVTYAIIGLLLVIFSYTLIRLATFLAKG